MLNLRKTCRHLFVILLNVYLPGSLNAALQTVSPIIHLNYESGDRRLNVSKQSDPTDQFELVSSESSRAAVRLHEAITGDLTLGIWICPEEFIYQGEDGFSDKSPVTVFELRAQRGEDTVLLRIHEQKLQLLYTIDGTRQVLFSAVELELEELTHLAVVIEDTDVVNGLPTYL